MKHLLISLTVTGALLSAPLSAQEAPPANWYNLDQKMDGVSGVSTEKAYSELLKGKTSNTVVVAILDSGIDAEHEDLQSVMWVNPGEKPNNGKDDDGNGYVDDIHGWNFIGGTDGRNVNEDTYEVTRLYAKNKYRFENADRDKLSKSVRKEYDEWVNYRKVVEKEREKAQTQLDRVQQSKSIIDNALSAMHDAVGDRKLTKSLIDSLQNVGATDMMIGINVYNEATAQGQKIETVNDMQEMIDEELSGGLDYFGNKLKYAYNPDFNPRDIVGDDYNNPEDRNYGNNDVEGPDAFHGTHVGGIVGAKRNNGIGINGVADNVALMSVRTVPNGDERDKDVANAIRYAVDNGASVINMSFGKGQSWNKAIVDEAVKYAAKNDVLLVHAAGNSSSNNDKTNNFPNDQYEKKGLFCKKSPNNWIEVGALSYMSGEDGIATFSNFGKSSVDLFAPGVAIYSTIPDSKYKNAQGTSMASPVVAGVAATLRSYFPELTAAQVKDILLESVTPIQGKVKRPDDRTLVGGSEISATGGVVNLYNAVLLAQKTKGKKKKKDMVSYKKPTMTSASNSPRS